LTASETELRGFAKAVLAAAFALFAVTAQASETVGQKLVLAATERQVHVTYFRAPGTAPRPAVLLLHGANGFDSQIAGYDSYASELATHGIDAYLVYYYSDADEQNMFGGNDVFVQRYAAWTRLVGDVAGDVLKNEDSTGKIGLVGFSNGGTLAGGTAARDPRITAAVIYYGTSPFPMDVPVNHFPPLLILHGDADTIIPVEQGRHLAQFAKELGGSAELVIYPGERHGFGARLQAANSADALNRTIAFLTQQLAAH
jgi:carboxymethylenebutenolidase